MKRFQVSFILLFAFLIACTTRETFSPWDDEVADASYIHPYVWSEYEDWLVGRFGAAEPMDFGVTLISYQGPYVHRAFTDEVFLQITQDAYVNEEEPWITRLKPPVATIRFVNPPALYQLVAELTEGSTKSPSEILQSVSIEEFQVTSEHCEPLVGWKNWVSESDNMILLSDSFGAISSTQQQDRIVLHAHDGVILKMKSQYADLGGVLRNLAHLIVDKCTLQGNG